MGDRSDTKSLIKKLIIIIAAAVALGIFIKNLVNYYMEAMQKISGVTNGAKEYTATFESKEVKPGCSFKGGGLRSMFSSMRFDLTDLKSEKDVSITCNAITSVIEIVVPDDINVVTIDISKMSAVRNAALEPFDSDKKILNVYISGFMSAVLIKKAA